MLLVCLSLLLIVFSGQAMAWSLLQTNNADSREDLYASAQSNPQIISKVKIKPITKVKPLQGFSRYQSVMQDPRMGQTAASALCCLPISRVKGWEVDAQLMFARTKGNAMLWNNTFGWGGAFGSQPRVDFNSQLALPEHNVVPTFSAKYRFQPRWSMQYQIMPTSFESNGNPDSAFQFGTLNYTTGQGVRSKWERLYQRMGLVYDPVLTPSSRVGLYADYVKLNERLSVSQVGGGFMGNGSTFDNDLDMIITGIEFEKCMKSPRPSNTLSCEAKAGIAFLNDAQGADLSAGLKYTLNFNNGRAGFVKGGYRYLTYKKKYSDVKSIDTAMDGGYVEMGFVF